MITSNIGCGSVKIGISANITEVFEFIPAAFHLQDKLARIERNERKDVTVEKLLRLIDVDHLTLQLSVQWLETLVNFIPHLRTTSIVSPRSVLLQPRRYAFQRKSVVHTLGTVANGTVTSELRDGLVDFLSQIGLDEESFKEPSSSSEAIECPSRSSSHFSTISRINSDIFVHLSSWKPFSSSGTPSGPTSVLYSNAIGVNLLLRVPLASVTVH